MLFPAVGNVVTRIITKEGFEESYLELNLKGNIKYYLNSIMLPVIYDLISVFVISIFYFPKGTSEEILRSNSFFHITALTIYIVSLSFMDCILTFGEEFSWRGYLTPKLKKLMNPLLAYVTSGIIWGLWHALRNC